jgi:hypothetical protein
MTILSKSDLQRLVEPDDGLCISIYLPTHRFGREMQGDPIRLKNALDAAEASLISAGLRAPAARERLAPLRKRIDDTLFWQHQSDGLAIFQSPQWEREYRLPMQLDELTVVSPRFHVKPLLPLLSGDGQFYLLALSQNEVRLLQGTRYSVSDVDIPDAPADIAEALWADDPERQQQWHSGTQGQSPGGKRPAMFHGHGVGDDDNKDRILRYFRQIDAALSRLLADDDAPLLLAGVDYLLPIYAEANTYPQLIIDGLPGNPEELSAEELHERAWKVVGPRFAGEKQAAAERYRALAGAGDDLATNSLSTIVRAARHGAVETLFVPLGVQRWGAYDSDSDDCTTHASPHPGDYDLLDYAAAHTLRTGGVVYAVEADEMPAEGDSLAILRYAI